MEEHVRVAVLEDCVGMIKRGMAIEDALDVIIKRYDEKLELLVNIICDVYAVDTKDIGRRGRSQIKIFFVATELWGNSEFFFCFKSGIIGYGIG